MSGRNGTVGKRYAFFEGGAVPADGDSQRQQFFERLIGRGKADRDTSGGEFHSLGQAFEVVHFGGEFDAGADVGDVAFSTLRCGWCMNTRALSSPGWCSRTGGYP